MLLDISMKYSSIQNGVLNCQPSVSKYGLNFEKTVQETQQRCSPKWQKNK
jgi:hypothetical protein